MGSPVICGPHDYMGFEPCPRCKSVGDLTANVLVEARGLREIYEKSRAKIPQLEGTSLDQCIGRVVGAIRAFDASPEARAWNPNKGAETRTGKENR